MRIPEKLFFRIGEVCDLIKVQPHVLRYWETEFPMLAPQKNPAGQRLYRRKDVEVVLRIRNLLYEEKFTIAGAKKKLLDEQHRGGSRIKDSLEVKTPETKPSEPYLPEHEPTTVAKAPEPIAPVAQPVSATPEQPPALTAQAKRALRLVKHELEDLLTLLQADVSIDR
ncbi:MAG TPA: MerR family transcriptional regulator [Blastocatellia bacterium]